MAAPKWQNYIPVSAVINDDFSSLEITKLTKLNRFYCQNVVGIVLDMEPDPYPRKNRPVQKNNADADPDPQISIHIKWAEVTVE